MKEKLHQLIEENIQAYHQACLEGQANAEWEFLKNLVNADKFFNQQKVETKKLESAHST